MSPPTHISIRSATLNLPRSCIDQSEGDCAFNQRIIAPEQDMPTPEHKRAGVINRLVQWMDQPI
jgi:hypothetical protein